MGTEPHQVYWCEIAGGLELNGRQIYDDVVMELEKLDEKLMQEYAMPPLDFVG